MPFTSVPMHSFYSIQCFYGRHGVALKQGNSFVALPYWKLAKALEMGLQQRTRQDHSVGIHLSTEEVESLTELVRLANMTDDERRADDQRVRDAHFDKDRQVDIDKLRELENQLIAEWQSMSGYDELKTMKKTMMDTVFKRIRELQALQNGGEALP